MQKEFYLNKLYPLQDEVMNIIGNLNNDFYLTGGTALSRFYLKHRFSDDLDFFENRNPKFKKHSDEFIDSLNEKYYIEIQIRSQDFLRLILINNNIPLKIELINDVPYHHGQFLNKQCKIDDWKNILSNKISAVSRNAPKDFADIIYISLNFKFSWVKIFDESKQKDAWVNEIEISNIINNFDPDRLKELNWIKKVENEKTLKKYLQKISQDILKGNKNSLSL